MLSESDNTKPLQLETVIAVYSNNLSKYIEKHSVVDNEILNAEPLDYEALIQTLKKVKIIKDKKDKALQFKGIVPDGLLYMNNSNDFKLIWYNNKQIRYLKFTNEKQNGRFDIPRLVFCYYKKQLYIYATTGIVMDKDTPLYKLMMPNIYSDSKMCFGNIKLGKIKYIESLMLSLENAFFNSKFDSWIGNEDVYEKEVFYNNKYSKHFFKNKYQLKTLGDLI